MYNQRDLFQSDINKEGEADSELCQEERGRRRKHASCCVLR